MFVNRLNIVKMSVFPNLIYRVTAIKIPEGNFVDIGKLILKFIRSGKNKQTNKKPKDRIANTILKEKNKAEELTLPDFKTY